MFREIETDLICANLEQPRKAFEPEKLDGLSHSIREHGVIQPLVVRPMRGTEMFELVAGERRFKAALAAGLERVPAVVRELSRSDSLSASLAENVQREDLSPVEEAEAYHRLMEAKGWTQERLAEKMGKSRPYVANVLRLRTLPAEVKTMLDRRTISPGHARAVLAVEDRKGRIGLAREIEKRGLSVRQTERKAFKNAAGNRKTGRNQKRVKEKDPLLAFNENMLCEIWGAKVSIEPDGSGGGRISIRYHDGEDFERVFARLSHFP